VEAKLANAGVVDRLGCDDGTVVETLEIAHVDDVIFDAPLVVEPALRQPHVQRHRTAFVQDSRIVTRTCVLALVTARRCTAALTTRTATDALLTLVLVNTFVYGFQVHVRQSLLAAP